MKLGPTSLWKDSVGRELKSLTRAHASTTRGPYCTGKAEGDGPHSWRSTAAIAFIVQSQSTRIDKAFHARTMKVPALSSTEMGLVYRVT